MSDYEPDLIWSDSNKGSPSYWGSLDFLAWLYNDSPVRDSVVVNDRWGDGTYCKHGGFLNCHDRYNPKKIQKRKFENAMTIDKGSWGISKRSDADDFLTPEERFNFILLTVGQWCLSTL